MNMNYWISWLIFKVFHLCFPLLLIAWVIFIIVTWLILRLSLSVWLHDNLKRIALIETPRADWIFTEQTKEIASWIRFKLVHSCYVAMMIIFFFFFYSYSWGERLYMYIWLIIAVICTQLLKQLHPTQARFFSGFNFTTT